jgi:hypothetical protein
MSLNYDMPEEAYEKLSDEEKVFYHESLPWLLFAIGIPGITKSSIPHIVARYPLNPVLTVHTIRESQLEKYIGMSVNVAFKTNAEFLKGLGNSLPKGTRKDGDLIYKELRDERI